MREKSTLKIVGAHGIKKVQLICRYRAREDPFSVEVSFMYHWRAGSFSTRSKVRKWVQLNS